METILLDCRYALGRFRAQPLATFIIVMTLALGIGATTAIFSVVNGLMLQATPFEDSDRLVLLQQNEVGSDRLQGFSASELADYQQQAGSLEHIAEYHNMTFTMYGEGDPLRVRTGVVSVNFFEMLGLQPVLGRLFAPGEDHMGAEPLMLLTYELWQSEFGGRTDVINQSVEMNNRAHKIIGVLPHFPQFPDVNDIYLTMPSCPWRSGENALSNRNMRMMSSFGQISEDADLTQVNQELSTVAKRLSQAYPEAYSSDAGFDASASSLNEELIGENRPYLLTLLVTTLLLLLIACANVSNLILSQHAKRQREFAVRASLGASRGRLIRLLLTESVILALIGGLVGLGIAFAGLDTLKEFTGGFTSLASEIRLDHRVMVFALAISLLAGLVCGLAPAFQKMDLVTALKEGGKASVTTSGGVARNSLLIGQFALSLTLLIVAGLSLKSLYQLQNVDGGYDPRQVEVMQLDLNWSVYTDGQQQWQFSQQLLNEVRQLPYVTSAGLSMTYPADTVAINYGALRGALHLDDRDFDPDSVLPDTFIRPASDGYLETMSASLLQGRLFERQDDEQAPEVAVINRSMAETLWPYEHQPIQSAINRQFSVDNGESWIRIVGVVDNIRERGLGQEADRQIYLPLAQAPRSHVAIVAKVAKVDQSQDVFQQDIKKIIAGLDSRQPLSKAESLQQALDNSLALQSMLAQLLSVFAVIALLITVSGISGVMGYLVNLRTREIGIRMAIGADQSRVMLMILGYGLKLTLVGLALGLGLAYWSGSLLADQLFELSAFELPVYAMSLGVLLLISIVGCFLPARRASTIPPMQALRKH